MTSEPSAAPGKRRHVQFSLVSLLAVTLVVAVSAAAVRWNSEGRNSTLKRLATELAAHGAIIEYGNDGLPRELYFVEDNGWPVDVTDKDLDRISRLTSLEVLVIDNGNVTDGGVSKLAKLPELEVLVLLQNPITDRGLAHLEEHRKLRELDVAHTDVTLGGLESLRTRRPNLKIVGLDK